MFRVARAEFTKIFKKPTVYIMALILVAACVISLFTFAPNLRTDNRVKLSTDGTLENYNAFESTAGSDNKTEYNKSIKKADDIVDYYEFMYTRNDIFNKEITNIFNTFNNLKLSSTLNDPLNTTNNSNMQAIKKSLDNLITTFNNYSTYEGVSYYNTITSFKNISNEVVYNKTLQKLTTLKTAIDALTTPKDLVEYFNANSSILLLQNINEDYINYIELVLNVIIKDIETIQTSLQNNVTINGSLSISDQISELTAIKNNLTTYNSIIDKLLTSNQSVAVISKENQLLFKKIYTRVYDIVDLTPQETTVLNIKNVVLPALIADKYLTQFHAFNNLLKYVNYDAQVVQLLKDYKKLAHNNQTEILSKIESMKNNSTIAEISEQITKYKLLSNTYLSLTTNEDILNTISGLSISRARELYGDRYKNLNEYEIKESITKDKFYLSNNTYEYAYLNNFSFNNNSGYDSNVYDYMFSALKICTLIIIVFTMLMAGSILSSEQDSGTIKLLLVRPYKRSKILSGKMLATFFFSLCFLVFSVIITFVAGYVNFGLPTMTNVLLVFNAQLVLTLSPALVMLIFVTTCLMDILFYLILAFMISVVFRTYAGSITTSLIVLIIASLLGILLPNSILYAFIPFTNISLFRYFGGAFNGVNNSNLSSLFITPIQSSMNIYQSLIVGCLFSIIMYIIAFTTFKKRDF